MASAAGTLLLRNLMCLNRRPWLPCRTQRYIRSFVMSSSLLLTITESHGFRALVAVIAAVIAAICFAGRGLRSLACGQLHSAEKEASSPFWARVFQGGGDCTREVPVLWFDTSGGREGPHCRGPRSQPSLVYCYVSHSQVRPLVDQAAVASRDWTGFRT